MRIDVVWDMIAAGVSIAGAAIDVKSRRIPNVLTYTTMLGGIVGRSVVQGGAGLRGAVFGGLIGGGLFLVFFLLHTMGAGDVKLMAAIGCLVGPGKALQIVLAAAIAGGILAIVYALWRRRLRATFANVGDLLRFHIGFKGTVHPTLNLANAEAVSMPYAVPIAVGVVYTVLHGVSLG